MAYFLILEHNESHQSGFRHYGTLGKMVQWLSASSTLPYHFSHLFSQQRMHKFPIGKHSPSLATMGLLLTGPQTLALTLLRPSHCNRLLPHEQADWGSKDGAVEIWSLLPTTATGPMPDGTGTCEIAVVSGISFSWTESVWAEPPGPAACAPTEEDATKRSSIPCNMQARVSNTIRC